MKVQREQKYSSTLYLTSVLDVDELYHHAPASFPRERSHVSVVQEAGWPQGWSGRVGKTSLTTGFDFRISSPQQVATTSSRSVQYNLPKTILLQMCSELVVMLFSLFLASSKTGFSDFSISLVYASVQHYCCTLAYLLKSHDYGCCKQGYGELCTVYLCVYSYVRCVKMETRVLDVFTYVHYTVVFFFVNCW